MIFGETRGSWGVSGEEISQIAPGFPLDFGERGWPTGGHSS